MAVFPSLEWTSNHLFLGLICGNTSETYVIHINSIIIAQQEELCFQQFFGPLELGNWSIGTIPPQLKRILYMFEGNIRQTSF